LERKADFENDKFDTDARHRAVLFHPALALFLPIWYIFTGGIAMKKKIVIGIFLALILATAIFFGVMAIDSYLYDMDPKNGVDMLEGVGAFLGLVIGGFFVWYEIDLFYTVYYFLFKAKMLLKSIINILANLSLVFIIFVFNLPDGTLSTYFDSEALIYALLAYMVLRAAYLIVCTFTEK
jgi:hypothetical protein